jgi:hypothetical protein
MKYTEQRENDFVARGYRRGVRQPPRDHEVRPARASGHAARNSKHTMALILPKLSQT